MDKTKIITIAKKLEVFGIGLIGVCFFSMGTTYFQERLLYQMPRILVPVYDLLGSTALAIAMLLLGIGLIVWGFVKWKSAAGNTILFSFLAGAGLVLGVFLANYNFKSSEDMMQNMEDRRQEQIEDVKQAQRPDFKNAEIDKYFDDFETLNAKLEKEISKEDVEMLEEVFLQLLSRIEDLIKQLNNNQKYEFSRYNAKLSIQWHDKMQEIRNK